MQNIRTYLQECCNKYGDFRVARAITQNEKKIWSKWRSVLNCWESEEGLRFLDIVNNRTLFRCEIILDVDDDISKEHLKRISKILDYYNCKYSVYFSGSKGYHFHLIIPEMMFRRKFQRQEIREFLIEKTDCDLMKKTEKSMIAIEGTPHWKTGNIKREVII